MIRYRHWVMLQRWRQSVYGRLLTSGYNAHPVSRFEQYWIRSNFTRCSKAQIRMITHESFEHDANPMLGMTVKPRTAAVCPTKLWIGDSPCHIKILLSADPGHMSVKLETSGAVAHLLDIDHFLGIIQPRQSAMVPSWDLLVRVVHDFVGYKRACVLFD